MADPQMTSDKPPMTPTQRELARHALGLKDGHKQSYRNRFLAGVMDEPAWRQMVRAGYAVVGAGTPLGHWFLLTTDGARAALLPGETLCSEDFPA